MKKSALKNKLLHRIMEQSKYALFEVCMGHFPRIEAIVVEAHAGDEDQSLWCSCDNLSLPFSDTENLPVILKFINRRKGNFIQIHGNAFISENKLVNGLPLAVSSPAANTHIQVRIHQVAWFDKKSGEVEFFA